MKTGKIIPNGVKLETHEYNTVLFFTTLGKTVELIPPSNVPHTRRPDFIMNGIEWEMKSPKGQTRSNLEHAFQAAVKQSVNIVFDLRRMQMPSDKAVTITKQLFGYSKNAKRLTIITKDGELLDLAQ